MTTESTDAVDLAILAALQADGRLSWADLGREVSMSPSAVTDRVRRLTERGVIAGYTAVVDPERLGLGIVAFVRLRYPTGNYKPFRDFLAVTPRILEAHHVTGDDCFILKLIAGSMRELEQLTRAIAGLGPVTTSVVYSTPLPRRAITAETLTAQPS